MTGKSSYDVELRNVEKNDLVDLGVLLDDGRKIVFKSFHGLIRPFEWITEEEALELEGEGDPIEAPPSCYKLQPEFQGRLICITGPPGRWLFFPPDSPTFLSAVIKPDIHRHDLCTSRPWQVNISSAAEQGTWLCLL